MPRFFELQRTVKPQNRTAETTLDTNVGEESLVIDERSRQSSVFVVEEKLHRLTPIGFTPCASTTFQH